MSSTIPLSLEFESYFLKLTILVQKETPVTKGQKRKYDLMTNFNTVIEDNGSDNHLSL